MATTSNPATISSLSAVTVGDASEAPVFATATATATTGSSSGNLPSPGGAADVAVGVAAGSDPLLLLSCPAHLTAEWLPPITARGAGTLIISRMVRGTVNHGTAKRHEHLWNNIGEIIRTMVDAPWKQVDQPKGLLNYKDFWECLAFELLEIYQPSEYFYRVTLRVAQHRERSSFTDLRGVLYCLRFHRDQVYRICRSLLFRPKAVRELCGMTPEDARRLRERERQNRGLVLIRPVTLPPAHSVPGGAPLVTASDTSPAPQPPTKKARLIDLTGDDDEEAANRKRLPEVADLAAGSTPK